MRAGRRPLDLSVDDIVALLRGPGAVAVLSPNVPVTQLDHALQTAALLERNDPGDVELAVAGLVHDIGHLVAGATDEAHAVDGAAAVRATLGERVAGIVALHVEAKRYLVTADGAYDDELSEDSVVSLGRQGGAFSAPEAAAFLTRPLAAEAVTLRRADDHGKDLALLVRPLDSWLPTLRVLEGRSASPPPSRWRSDR